MIPRASQKTILRIGLTYYLCVVCGYRVKICSLCTSQGKPPRISYITIKGYEPENDMLIILHFMKEHIPPHVSDPNNQIMVYEASSSEIGTQLHCDNFLSVLTRFPQLCYLIPSTLYRLVSKNADRVYVKGFTDFGEFVYNWHTNYELALQYLMKGSYTCLYCERIYDSLPSIDIVENHVKHCID
jgi:hypothetical protein